jgi:hypothetical protein
LVSFSVLNYPNQYRKTAALNPIKSKIHNQILLITGAQGVVSRQPSTPGRILGDELGLPQSSVEMLQSEPAPKAGSESDGVELEIAVFVGDESAAPVSEVPADQKAQEEETPAADHGQDDGGNDTAASDSEDETLLKLVTDAVRVCLFVHLAQPISTVLQTGVFPPMALQEAASTPMKDKPEPAAATQKPLSADATLPSLVLADGPLTRRSMARESFLPKFSEEG